MTDTQSDFEHGLYDKIIDIEGCYAGGKLRDKLSQEQYVKELVVIFAACPEDNMQKYLTEAKQLLEPLEESGTIINQLEAIVSTKTR